MIFGVKESFSSMAWSKDLLCEAYQRTLKVLLDQTGDTHEETDVLLG